MDLANKVICLLFLGRDTALHIEKPERSCSDVGAALDAWNSDFRNISRDLTLGELSEETGIGMKQLLEYFHFDLNKDFRTWKAESKVRWSMSIIRHNPGITITDAARMSGFGNLSNFRRAFNKTTGISPSEWAEDAGENWQNQGQA